jgi:hypothetical protein
MKHCILTILSLAMTLSADEPVSREITADTPGITVAPTARWDAANHFFYLEAGENALIPILKDQTPQIGLNSYQLRGEVRHENVGSTGYLETWTAMGPQKAFSRTLGESGIMGKLTGTSTWREFILPMNMTGAAAPVNQIEFNVYLPNGGKVWLRNLRLESLPGPAHYIFKILVWGLVFSLLLALAIWKLITRKKSSEAEMKRMLARDV